MKRPAFQFYPGDWRKDPCLSRCSPATRGVWLDLLCAIHNLDDRGAISGTVEQLARATGCFPADMQAALAELEATGTADVTKSGGVVTVVSRRFRREWGERNGAKLRKQRQRSGGTGGDVTPESRQTHTPSSSSSSSSDQRSPHARAHEDQARSGQPRCDRAKLEQAWVKHVQQLPGPGLLELITSVEQHARLRGVHADELAEKMVAAFVAWADGQPQRYRPGKTPAKLVEHWAKIVEIVDGKRAAVPTEEPPEVRRFSSHPEPRRKRRNVDDVLAAAGLAKKHKP